MVRNDQGVQPVGSGNGHTARGDHQWAGHQNGAAAALHGAAVGGTLAQLFDGEAGFGGGGAPLWGLGRRVEVDKTGRCWGLGRTIQIAVSLLLTLVTKPHANLLRAEVQLLCNRVDCLSVGSWVLVEVLVQCRLGLRCEHSSLLALTRHHHGHV